MSQPDHTRGFCSVRLGRSGPEPVEWIATSLQGAVEHEPVDGVYTVARTFPGGRSLLLDAHFDRLEESARLEAIPFELDRPSVRKAILWLHERLTSEHGVGSIRFRLTVDRADPARLLISAEGYEEASPELLREGVRCVSIPRISRAQPRTKTLDWMHDRSQIVLPDGIYEGLLLSPEGDVLEGIGSNFYGILAGVLRTAGSGMLPGIGRLGALAVAPAILEVVLDAVQIDQLPQLEEAFLTSSSRGIVPIVEIDGKPIGAGTPGPVVARLREAYAAWVDRTLESVFS